MIDWAAGSALVAWLYLLLGRGGFWRMRPADLPKLLPSPTPSVAVVIPARNEASVIARAVASLAAQQYPAPVPILLVDDESGDGTADIARSAASARLTVVRSAPLPNGWTGKLWAVAQGVERAQSVSPEFLLLTDADIVHPPENLAALVAQAARGYDLVSLMVRLRCETLAERALIPAFVFFFFLLYPPAWIRNPRRATAGAAGGCLLIRRRMLESIGGVERIRGSLIDDCALARAVKQAGGRVWLGLSGDTVSMRIYPSFGDIGRMISRTAFTQLRYSSLALVGTLAGLTAIFLVPPAAALLGSRLGIAAWIALSAAYFPVLRFYRRSPLWAPLLPLAAAFYMGATLHSAWMYWRGTGGVWKGRVQAHSRSLES
jgi:hopene-associated glycosyltransferase HpnB